ncbi:PTS sugar transporter subunit IIA [Actinomyces gaoshouyii]|uniref:PTS glucose transporter subunit IIA n=1 Tax=Actinomyces gaoshouyii TaxID=1960083 RepID=A0A8H9H975_9ACTO|nr:PTS glucose transporter subunit IIA [Actinomyces gaoshouyii]GGO98567.1 PTS glucose transporter subunit IIA [Actinomyces gaoshouyii]
MTLEVLSPLSGTVIALEDVPDPVFSGRLIGPGIAVDPPRAPGQVVTLAPIPGRVAKIHPHAFVIAADDGRSVLVHLGLDTLGLEGRGFTVHREEGARVRAGDPIITWSPARIEGDGFNPVVPIIALDAGEADLALTAPGTAVAPGNALIAWS